MGTTDTAKMNVINEDLNDGVTDPLAWEVQNLVGGMSEHFVPQPSDEGRTNDGAINGLGEFKMRCRWAEYWRNHYKERAIVKFCTS